MHLSDSDRDVHLSDSDRDWLARLIREQGDRIMAAIDDLNTAVAANTAAVQAVAAEVATLQAGGNDAAVAAAAAQIASNNAALTALVPPAA